MNTLRTSRTRGSVQFCRLAGCLTALAIAAPAVLQAQDATPAPAASAPAAEGTGSVSGRVMNAGNGMYLGKAVIKVVGTNIEYITDDYGFYTLNNLPAGNITLNVTYTGLNPTTQEVAIKAGETATQDIKLSRTRLTVDKSDKDAVILDEFQVETERFKNAAEIAINEERYSPTIKNVVSADAFGDIPDGNIGEFVKFIPGVQVGTGYDNAGSMAALDQNISQVSVRGFSPDLTAITIDGVPVTNASPASLSRSIGLDMMSVNNASRVEVVKVPTPDMPSNSPGGSINLVTRSAFEQSKPTLQTKLMFNMNSENLRDFGKKTPGPANKSTYKSLPGAEFAYTVPLTKNLGVTVSGGWSETFYENHQAKTDYLYSPSEVFTTDTYYDFSPVGGGIGGRIKNTDGSRSYIPLTNSSSEAHAPWNPLFYRFQATDTPNIATRFNGSMKVDWKPTTNQKVSVGYTYGKFDTVDAQRRLQFYNGNKYAYLDWNADRVVGMAYTANGMKTASTNNGAIVGTPKATLLDPKATINMTVTTRDRAATTHTGYVDYKFQRGPWTIDANINGSKSEGSYTDIANGHFSEVETSVTGGQLIFDKIEDGIPGKIQVFTKPNTTTGQVSMLDWTQLANWNELPEDGLKAKSGDTHASDTSLNAKVNVRRDLDFLPFSWMTMSAKTGWYHQEQTAKKWGLGTGYYETYNAAKAGQTLEMVDYLDDEYMTSPGFGLPSQQWLDTYKLYALKQKNPDAFGVFTEANKYDNYISEATQQKQLKETSDQWYFQLDGRALKNRMSYVAGIRGETATRKGYNTRKVGSWNFLHDSVGKIWRDTSVSAYATGIRLDQASSLLFKGLTFTQNPDGTVTTTGTLDPTAVALRTRLDQEQIWYPTTPIPDKTLAAAKLQRIPYDKVDGKVSNKPNFMTSVAYDITKDVTARLSYSKSSGRPDWENGILSVGGGSIEITESTDPNAASKGTIVKSNPDLKPSENDSWDAQLAWYTPSGGKLAVSGFYKLTKNPQETISVFSGDPLFESLLEAESLNPDDFEGWTWKTTVNTAGTGKTIGYELEASQNLGILGSFGKNFNVFASFSHHYKKQNNTTYLTIKPTAGSSASGGVNFSWKRLNVLTRWVWLEEKYLGSTTYTINGQDYILGRYTPATVNIDLNIRYQLTRQFGLFFNGRNIFNTDTKEIRHDADGTFPSWAKTVSTKRYGVTAVVGIQATF